LPFYESSGATLNLYNIMYRVHFVCTGTGRILLHLPGPIKIKGQHGFLKKEEFRLLDLTVEPKCSTVGSPDRGIREGPGESRIL